MGRLLLNMRFAGYCGCVLLLTTTTCLTAQDSPPTRDVSVAAPLKYHRVFVPVNKLGQLARDHLPVSRKRFERLMEDATAQPEGPALTEATVERAFYAARLEQDRLVDGRAELDIRRHAPGPTLLPLVPCGIPIREPLWHGAEPEPATVGWAPPGRVTLFDARSATLSFKWALQGQREPSGGVSFSLKLPSSVTTRLVFEIPAGYRLLSSHGILQELPPERPGPLGGTAIAETTTPTSPDTAGDPRDQGERSAPAAWRRWQLDLGGNTSVVVRTVSERPRGDQTAIVLYRQETQYHVAPSGIDLAVDLQLRIAREPLSRLDLELSPALTLLSARHGEQEIDSTILSNPNDTASKIRLNFPTALEPGQVNIHLQAVTRQDPRHLTQLPRIKPLDLLWQEETVVVHVHSPLEFQKIEPFDCRQFQTAPIGDQSPGETTRFQLFDQDGHIQFELGSPRSEVFATSGTSFLFGIRTSTAEQQMLLSAEGVDRFELRGQLSPFWSLDSLTLEPPELLEDWQVTPARRGPRDLRIRLRTPLTAGQVARLTMRGRGPRVDLGRAIDSRLLQFVAFPGCHRRQALIRAQGVSPYRIQNLSMGTSRPLILDTLDSNIQGLFTVGHETVYDVTNAETAPSFVLKSNRPVYRADLQVQFIADEDHVEETFVVDCHPSEGALRKILLFLSGPQQGPISWNLVAPLEGKIEARLLAPNEKRDAEIVGQGHVWELALPAPLATDFRLIGQRTRAIAPQETVSLLALPRAASQRGTLLLASRGTQHRKPHFQRRLFGIPEKNRVLSAAMHLGSYRYDPLRDALTTGPPLVTISTLRKPIGEHAWVSASELRSRYATNGKSFQQAIYWIEQNGGQVVTVRLPEGAALQRVLIDGVPVTVKSAAAAPHPFSVQLAPRSGRTALLIDYCLTRSPLKFFDRLTAQAPQLDLPILCQQWKLWLPHGQFVWDGDRTRQNLGFTSRLLGPLSRHTSGQDRAQQACRFIHGASSAEFPSARNTKVNPLEDTRLAAWDIGDEICVPFIEGAPTSVRIYGRHSLRLVGWSCFFVGFAFGWAAGQRLPRVRAVVLAACLAGCLLLPASWSPLPTALFWGLLLATFARWTGVLRAHSPSVASGTQVAHATPILQLLIVGYVATTILTGNASAADTADTARNGNAPIYRVVVPIEPDESPSKYVYLPQDFYRHLIQLSRQRTLTRPTWSISKTTISVTLEVESKTHLLTLGSLQVTFDLDASEAGIYVQIPLHQALGTRPRSIKIDGREPDWQWDESARAIRFSLSQRGRYRVTVECEPETDERDNQRSMEVALPSAPDAELRLVGPANRPTIHVKTDNSSFTLEPNGGSSHVVLGCTGRLQLRWPARPVTQREVAPVVADQLMWMRVRPGIVTVDALIKVESGDRLIDRIELHADESLRLLSLGPGAPAGSVTVQPGEVQLVQVELDMPARGDFVLPLRFLMSNVSGVGSIPVPRLQLVDLETRNRWLAVTVDSSMAYDEAFGEQLSSISSQAFSRQWGPSTSEPNFAVQLSSDVANLKLSTIYRESPAEANERLQITCRPRALRLDYRAEVNLEEGVLFHHRLTLPDEIRIQRVEVWQDRLPIAHRWALDKEHQLNIFLKQPLTRPHQLRIMGTLRNDLSNTSREAPQTILLPRIDLVTADSTAYRFDIVRAPEVAVAVDDIEGLQRVAQSKSIRGETTTSSDRGDGLSETSIDNGRPDVELTRPATSLIRNSPLSPDASLRCWRHTPTATGSMVTTMRRGPKNWWAGVKIQLEVTSGPLDLVRLEVPTPLAKHFEFSTNVISHVTPLPDNRSILEIWPTDAENTQQVQLDMRVPLDVEARDMPSLQLIDLPLVKQYLALPLQLDNQELAWQISHLRPATIPTQLHLELPPNYTAYEVMRHPFLATIRSLATTNKNARIVLCDAKIDCCSGRVVSRITYWIAPPPPTDFVLDVPRMSETIEVRVDGQPVQPYREAPGRIAIPMARGQRARQVEVLSVSQCDPDSDKGLLQLPTPRNLRTEQTLWTLRFPSTRVRPVGYAVEETTEATQHFWRLAAINRLTRAPAGNAAQWSQEEQGRWYHAWHNRYQRIRDQLTESLDNHGLDDPRLASIETWDQDQEAIAQRYPWDNVAEAETATSSETASDEANSETTWRFVSTEPQSAVGIQPVSTIGRDLARFVLALVLAIGIYLTGRVFQHSGPRSWLARSIHPVAVIAGIAICTLVTPSLLGWTVIGLAVLSSLVSSFRSFAPQDSQSTILSEFH